MARRTFDVIDIVEILMHWHAGRPIAVVAESLGVDRKTIRKYVAKAEADGLAPGGAALPRDQWAALVRDWFPELTDPRARSRTHAAIDVHRERIEAMLKTNKATTVYQRLHDEHGLDVGISSFRRYVWLEFPDEALENKVTVLRPAVAPGEEAQIDYGYLGRWFDPSVERWRRVWAFVMVLAMSRHMFVRPTFRMDQTAWVAAHRDAFDFFGGVPRRLVPDNLKTGVIRPDIYDPKLNHAYAELAAHYKCLIDPARAAKPKDKPRVERPMSYVRDSYFAGREWIDLSDMQHGALTWCTEVAGGRSHRSLEGASPLSIFAAVESPALIALPHIPFELAAWSRPKVGPDCHIKVGKALYSVPWRFIGQHVDARAGERTVEVFSDGMVIKTWARIEKGRQTDWADYPPHKVAFFMRTPTWCRRRAAELGPSVSEVVLGLLHDGALHHLRGAQGVIGLAERHGEVRLDQACRRAIDVGDPGYRTVKGILVAGTEAEGTEVPRAPLAPAHLHGADTLFAHLGETEVAG
ncbi:MAG TPA: IS21 family transposase [Acidimicrobiales bacterium]|jgi:transposase|nr:IS21 family transposase [Acidimicrobiales bacterium]